MSLIKELICLGVKNVATFDYDTDLKQNNLPAAILSGDFYLNDPKACLTCPAIAGQSGGGPGCNHAVMNIHSDRVRCQSQPSRTSTTSASSLSKNQRLTVRLFAGFTISCYLCELMDIPD